MLCRKPVLLVMGKILETISIKYLFYQLLVYVKIIKTVSGVTQARTNAALLAIYLTVSSFTKTTVKFLFAKVGSMMDIIIANDTGG